MKKFFFLSFVMTLLTVNLGFAADEIHWTLTGQNSVTFDWRGTASENSIGYGLSPGAYTRVIALPASPAPSSSPGPFWEAKLTGLKENAWYYYSIGNGPERVFHTAPPRGSADFTIYAQGNIGDTTNYFNMGIIQDLITTDLIATGQPAFVMGLGNLTVGRTKGKAAVDQHFNDVMTWSKNAAYMPVWGNLDALSSSTDGFNNYKGRFDVPNSQTSPGSPLAGGKDWYWFDYGNTRFITLPEPWTGAWSAWNTKATALMAQAQADPSIQFVVTFVHQPAYSSGHYRGLSSLKTMLDTLGDKYSKYVLNVNAHSVNYERSYPQHGVVHVTAGTGGTNLQQDGSCLWLTCAKPSWSAYRAMHQGALKLHFTASGIEGSFICGPAGGGINDVNCTQGSVVDSFTIGASTVAPLASSGMISAAAAIATSSAPDVIVTQVSYANGIFTATVKNQGTAATPAGKTVDVGYSVDGTYRTWCVASGPLAAGASVAVGGTCGSPYVIPAGTHTIMAYVDDDNKFAESNESNNQLIQSVTNGTITTTTTGSTATASGADVVISGLSYANGIFTATVKNQGTAATPAGKTVDVGYSVDGTYRTWCIVPGPLAAGASVAVGGTCGSPYVISAGTHTIMAYVDDDNKFAESNESNNQLTQSVTNGTVTSTSASTSTTPTSITPSTTGRTYYVATTGSDSNSGTIGSPFATIQKAHNVAVAGDTIYVRGGTHTPPSQINITRSGSTNSRINLWAYPGELAVVDGSKLALHTDIFRITNASWWHIRGLELRNAARSAIRSEGASHNNIFENNNVHHSGQNSTVGTGIGLYGTAANTLILNNDSHHNRDTTINGGNSDGFQIQTTGAGTVLRGNRVWRNSDDGYDFYNKQAIGDSGAILVENNWSFENGYDDNLQPLGDGNGFKLGGRDVGSTVNSGGHTVRNNLAWGNGNRGFNQNGANLPLTLYNNTAYNHPQNYSFPTGSGSGHVLRNNIAYGSNGVLQGVSETNNSWNLSVTVNTSDFVSMSDTCSRGTRQADGSLPNCNFLKLTAGSDLINKGTVVGLPYNGNAPDLGAFEF